MLGFYNRSVILTYIGLGLTILGISLAVDKNFNYALICLIGSGFCDMFDGRIARMTKRTKDAEVFGIQIDSLCDVICFGVLPAVIGITYGVRGIGIVIISLFVIAGVIRLGYFNVMEQKRQEETDQMRKFYEGLPITSTAILFPLYWCILELFDVKDCTNWFIGFYLVIGFLFVSKIKVKKPGLITMIVFMVLALIIIAKLLKIF